jgi:hypothetical protein
MFIHGLKRSNRTTFSIAHAKSPRPAGQRPSKIVEIQVSRALALASLEAAIRLVDDVGPAATANHPAIAMTRLQRLQGIANLHGRKRLPS